MWALRLPVIAFTLVVSAAAAVVPPLRPAPHHTASELADQLSASARKVAVDAAASGAPDTDGERVVAENLAGFAEDAEAIRVQITRYYIDPTPALDTLSRLNQRAWAVHRSLERAPRYRRLLEPWAVTVSLLRRLGAEIGKPPRR